MTAQLMSIGELAEAVGVPDSTIRYWERQGLTVPTTWASGQRRYDQAAVDQLRLLRLQQEVGFSIAEMRRLREWRHVDPAAWRNLVHNKISHLQRQQGQIEYARTLLEHALTCDAEFIVDCPGFQAWFDQWQPHTNPATSAGATRRR